MAEVLLINPSRRKGRKMARRKTRSAAQKAATRRMIAANRSRSGPRKARKSRRRSNPINTIAARRRMHMRKINPVGGRARRASRRRSNPISLGGVTPKSIVSAVKDAVIGAGGAVAVDMVYNRINPMLPASLQKIPGGSLGVGDGVKALLTIVLGKVLARPTRGLSVKAAQGSLTVQAHQIITGLLPAGVVGYYSPARITQGTQRVGPNRTSQAALNAYIARGTGTPLLNGTGAYVRGKSPLLSGAREREGITSMR